MPQKEGTLAKCGARRPCFPEERSSSFCILNIKHPWSFSLGGWEKVYLKFMESFFFPLQKTSFTMMNDLGMFFCIPPYKETHVFCKWITEVHACSCRHSLVLTSPFCFCLFVLPFCSHPLLTRVSFLYFINLSKCL